MKSSKLSKFKIENSKFSNNLTFQNFQIFNDLDISKITFSKNLDFQKSNYHIFFS